MQAFVANIPWTSTEDDLRNVFETQGILVEAVHIMKGNDGRSKGFGFVTMDSRTKIDSVIDRMNGHPMGTRALIVERAKGGTKRQHRSS